MGAALESHHVQRFPASPAQRLRGRAHPGRIGADDHYPARHADRNGSNHATPENRAKPLSLVASRDTARGYRVLETNCGNSRVGTSILETERGFRERSEHPGDAGGTGQCGTERQHHSQ